MYIHVSAHAHRHKYITPYVHDSGQTYVKTLSSQGQFRDRSSNLFELGWKLVLHLGELPTMCKQKVKFAAKLWPRGPSIMVRIVHIWGASVLTKRIIQRASADIVIVCNTLKLWYPETECAWRYMYGPMHDMISMRIRTPCVYDSLWTSMLFMFGWFLLMNVPVTYVECRYVCTSLWRASTVWWSWCFWVLNCSSAWTTSSRPALHPRLCQVTRKTHTFYIVSFNVDVSIGVL